MGGCYSFRLKARFFQKKLTLLNARIFLVMFCFSCLQTHGIILFLDRFRAKKRTLLKILPSRWLYQSWKKLSRISSISNITTSTMLKLFNSFRTISILSWLKENTKRDVWSIRTTSLSHLISFDRITSDLINFMKRIKIPTI